MFAHYFITRPVGAVVLSVLLVVAGSLALTALPISQYPDVVPPQVVVTAAYPGQNALKVSTEVASPIEEQVNGVEDMLYMESQCTNDGAMRLVITFKIGTDPDKAQVLVQNRVSIALAKLPEVVKNIGVTTKKQSTAILLVVSVYSENGPDGKAIVDPIEVSNYARLQVRDELSRITGVGDVVTFGRREYSMRIWLDPLKMNDYKLDASSVTAAIRSQNSTVAAGQIGAAPAVPGQSTQLVVTTRGRLPDAAAFERIVLKQSGESLVRLGDVVRDVKIVDGKEIRGVELGARSYDSSATLDGLPSIGLPIFQLPGANAFATAQAVRAKMKELEASFPTGMKYAIVFDPTTFVQASVQEVVHTLFEAIILVAVVVLVFLQNWRAAVIPMIAVPVSLVGTLAAMYAFGYSINNLTLFGLVLAIGIVVDDAIVVVEAVEFHMAKGLSPLDATKQALTEVSGAIIGVSLVLTSVFLPSAIIPGLTGQFFKQFAVTIAVSTLISAFNSLTLTPALCPLFLKRHDNSHSRTDALPAIGLALIAALAGSFLFGTAIKGHLPDGWPSWMKTINIALVFGVIGYLLSKPVNYALGKFFTVFNVAFERFTKGYGWVVGRMIRVSLVVLAVYVGLLALTGYGFTKVPAGFLPQQDQGYLVVDVQLPEGRTLQQSEAVIAKVTDICLGPIGPDGKRDATKGIRGIAHVTAISGYSILSSANIPNNGGIYLSLDAFETRKGRTADMIVGELNGKLASIMDARAIGFGAPPILGLGNAGGFKLQVQDRANYGLEILESQAANLAGAGMKERGIPFVSSTFHSGSPQIDVRINVEDCFKKGIPESAVKDALGTYLAPYYVNDFTAFNRNWQVNVQADAPFRKKASDILNFKVRNPTGEMVPLGSLVTITAIDGPNKVNRFNQYPAADLNGFTIPALISSGEAIEKIEALAKRDLPQGLTYAWADMAYQQVQSQNSSVAIPGVFEFTGDTTLLVFGLSTLLAFLVLAFLYESYLLPLAVVLIVPMCLLSALVGVMIRNLDLNVFTQIGLVVLVGLASKNAILIVEFAKQKRESGMPRYEAAVEAATQRLRPILMTSFAFILGVLPLVVAEGAGAEMRQALGTAVFSGMIGVTIFGILLTPTFYAVLQRFRDRGEAPTPPVA